MANFGQEGGCDVTYLIMSDGGKASCVTNHGMINRESLATAACSGSVGELPVVPQADSIAKLPLMKKKAMIREWESC